SLWVPRGLVNPRLLLFWRYAPDSRHRPVISGRRFLHETRTPRLRAEGPAPYQPGPKRGTSVGPDLEAKTRRGLKARSIGCRVCVRFGAGLSALSPRVEPFLGRCPRLVWSRAFGPGLRPSIAAFGLIVGDRGTRE